MSDDTNPISEEVIANLKSISSTWAHVFIEGLPWHLKQMPGMEQGLSTAFEKFTLLRMQNGLKSRGLLDYHEALELLLRNPSIFNEPEVRILFENAQLDAALKEQGLEKEDLVEDPHGCPRVSF